MIYGLLLIMMLLMTDYLLAEKVGCYTPSGIRGMFMATLGNTNLSKKRYHNTLLDDKTVEKYKQGLQYTLNTTKLFLRPGLSLEELSLESNIPKHHFSQLLNVHLNKTFYQYIATYRIQEAIFHIENDHNMTIESLAYECGFNSKTSFNRYFKEITGLTPSEYRKKRP